jgi:hypothetical protein
MPVYWYMYQSIEVEKNEKFFLKGEMGHIYIKVGLHHFKPPKRVM